MAELILAELIYGLVLKYDEELGALNLHDHGFNISKKTFRILATNLIGGEMARVMISE